MLCSFSIVDKAIQVTNWVTDWHLCEDTSFETKIGFSVLHFYRLLKKYFLLSKLYSMTCTGSDHTAKIITKKNLKDNG